MNRKKWFLIGLTLAVLAGAYGGYRLWSGKSSKPLQAAYQTVRVRKGALDVKISGTGNIEASQRESIKASGSGKIADVKVKQGDKVKKGQILATFEQDGATNSANQIRSKQLDLEKKQLDLQSLMDQYKQTPDDDKRADLAINLRKQQLDIESTQADIQILKADNGSLDPITAPVDGTLATFSIAKGDTIGGQAATNGNLGEVVDYDHLQMLVSVDELDIPKVIKDQEATVLVEALPNQTFTGKVKDVSQEGTASNGVASFAVTIALNEVKNLKVGMSAEASILVQQKANALYLPIEAVQSFGRRYFVMVPSAESAIPIPSGFKRRAVQVGIHNEDYIEITSGIKEGESVVLPTAVSSGSSQNRTGSNAIPGFGIGGGAGFQGGGFGGGNRSSNGGTRQNGARGNQGGGSRG